MYQIYGISNCDTMKKALTWLKLHQISYTFHDYKTKGIAVKQLNHWFSLVDWNLLINTRGTTYRKLDPDLKARLKTADEAATVLATYPSMIKRPVLIKNNRIEIGFTPNNYQNFIVETMDVK